MAGRKFQIGNVSLYIVKKDYSYLCMWMTQNWLERNKILIRCGKYSIKKSICVRYSCPYPPQPHPVTFPSVVPLSVAPVSRVHLHRPMILIVAQVSERLNKRHLTIHIHIHSHMVAEHGPDAPVPQMAEQLLEVPKIISQCRILQQTLDILVPQVVEEILEVIKVILQERISERIVEQIVDVSGSESLAATLASEVASKNSCAHVTADHEVSAKTSAEELKTLAEATQVLQSETCGARGLREGLHRGVEGVDRGNESAPIGDGWSRQTDVPTVSGKFKCCSTDIDRSQRIRYGDSGQTAR